MTSRFADLLSRLASSGNLAERREINLALAKEYADDDRPALGCLERAWLLGERSISVVRELTAKLVKAGRVHDALDRLREAGFDAIRRNDPDDLARAVIHFGDIAHEFDRPMQDDLLSRATIDFLKPYRPHLRETDIAADDAPHQPPRLRIGCVLWLDDQSEPVINAIPVELIAHHDRDAFAWHFYSLFSEHEAVAGNPKFTTMIRDIRARDAVYVPNSEGGTSFERAKRVADRIADDEIDVLILLCQFPSHFLLAALRPAPILLGLNCAVADTNSSIALDGLLSGLRQTLSESLCDATLTTPSYTALAGRAVAPTPRASLELPLHGPLIVTSGRRWKFADPRFWSTVQSALRAREQLHVIVIGLTAEELAGFGIKLDPALARRVRLLGFRTDFRELVAMGDIYLDTFPVGGGYAMFEAITLGLPCVFYRADPRRLASFRTNYSPIADLSDDPDIALERDDGAACLEKLLSLIDASDERQRTAQSQRHLLDARPDNATYMREIEATILHYWRAARSRLG
jgi:hypothetical protein